MTHPAASLATRLREARRNQGLSQRALSDLTGLPQAQISRIEAGAVDLRLSTLTGLAHALGLELTLVPHKAMPAVRALTRDILNPSGPDRETRPAYALDENEDD